MKWQQLFVDFERYVSTPAGPERMPLLNGVFRATAEYLSMTEHKHKFHHSEFVKVLHDSVKMAKAFSAQDAEESFRAMERIARNLYLQPWRIDQFRSIKKWNHLYKCRIEPCLAGAERIFKLIGYDETGDEFLLNLDALKSRAPRKLLEVAYDCFVACVECRLMGTIRSLVENGEHLPWAKILKARETVVGDVQKCAARIDPKSTDHLSDTVLFSVDASERKESLLLPELQAPPSWDDMPSLQFVSPQDPWSVISAPTSSLRTPENERSAMSIQAGTMISVPVQGGLRRTNFTSSDAAGPPPVPPHQQVHYHADTPSNSVRYRGETRAPLPGFERNIPVQQGHTAASVPPEQKERSHYSSLGRPKQSSGLSGERNVPVYVDPSYYSQRHSSYLPQQTASATPESVISELNDRMTQMTSDLRTARQKAQTVTRTDGTVECPKCQMIVSPTTIICPHCNQLINRSIYR